MVQEVVSRLVDNEVISPDILVVESGDGITHPQQYSIDAILLISNDGKAFDLKPSLIELNIHEDLFAPAISGYIMIVDGSGFLETLNITGFNFIQISFGKVNPNDDPAPYTKTFRVYKIGERYQVSRQKEQYPIYFCSEEVLLNEQIKITKSFPNSTIDLNIINILTNGDGNTPPQGLQVDSGKIGIIEQAKGSYNFIVPNLKPFEAINWLCTYAQPAAIDNASADMIFYENRNGFNFRSLQSIMSDKVYASYNYSPQSTSITQNSINYNITSILSYKFIRTFDSLKMTSSGAYANKLVTIDPLLRTSKSIVFNYDSNFSNSGSLNNQKITSDYKNRFGQKVSEATESVFKFAVGNADERTSDTILNVLNDSVGGDISSITYDIGIETYVPYRTAQLAILNHTKVEVLVPGDPALTVGSIVLLNLPSMSTDSAKEASLDSYYSAKYMVTAVRHKMDVTGTYQSVFEAVTDSVPQAYVTSGGPINQVNIL